MPTAEIQIYTLSPIRDWKVKYDEQGKFVPRDNQVKYDSDALGFKNWIQISQETFDRTALLLSQNSALLEVGGRLPFSFMTSSKPEILFHYEQKGVLTYLSDGVLIAVRPRTEKYTISPDSPHFREGDLAENVDMALFSETRGNLESVARKMQLPFVSK